jgi:hypothetical protein
MMDNGAEGVVLNEQGASAAAPDDRNAGARQLSLGRSVSRTHCALARCCPLPSALCFSLFLSRGLCVDHERWDECGPPVRIPLWNARVRHGETGSSPTASSPRDSARSQVNDVLLLTLCVCVLSLFACLLLRM